MKRRRAGGAWAGAARLGNSGERARAARVSRGGRAGAGHRPGVRARLVARRAAAPTSSWMNSDTASEDCGGQRCSPRHSYQSRKPASQFTWMRSTESNSVSALIARSAARRARASVKFVRLYTIHASCAARRARRGGGNVRGRQRGAAARTALRGATVDAEPSLPTQPWSRARAAPRVPASAPLSSTPRGRSHSRAPAQCARPGGRAGKGGGGWRGRSWKEGRIWGWQRPRWVGGGVEGSGATRRRGGTRTRAARTRAPSPATTLRESAGEAGRP